jgi:hypothetical protein
MALGYIRAISYMRRYVAARYRRISILDAFPRMKAGDILLFVAACHGFSNSLVSRQYFSHVAILVEIGGRFYVSESTLGSELMPRTDRPKPYILSNEDRATELRLNNGPSLSPPLVRLKHYSGLVYYMPLNKPLNEGRKTKLAAAAQEPSDYPTFGQMLAGLAGIRTKSRHCFQHIGALLEAAGLTPLDDANFDSGSLIQICDTICNLANVPLENGFMYEAPVEVLQVPEF